MIFYSCSSGSYSKVYANEHLVIKRPVDPLNSDTAFFLFREAFFLSKGYGPGFRGICYRPSINMRHAFVGFVMERMEASLSNLDVDFRADLHVPLFRSAAEKLARMHADGFVHCDIKPGNILISSSGEALLTDFGLSGYASDCGPAPCDFFDMVYTPPFRPPEHLFGCHKILKSSDSWAFGMTMYICAIDPNSRILKLSEALKIIDLLELIVPKCAAERRAKFKALKPELPLDFLEIIVECLDWHPAIRPSAAQIAIQLKEYSNKPFTQRLVLSRLTLQEDCFIMDRSTKPILNFPEAHEKLKKTLENLCSLINLKVNADLLNRAKELYNKIQSLHERPQNVVGACILAIYTVRESRVLQFPWCAKMMNCSMPEYEEYLEEIMFLY